MTALIVIPCAIGCVTLMALIAGLVMMLGGSEAERLEAAPDSTLGQHFPPAGPVEDTLGDYLQRLFPEPGIDPQDLMDLDDIDEIVEYWKADF